MIVLKTRGSMLPHLKQEALRLVRSIPKMTPAKQRGTAVAVTFTLPINFSLQ